MKENILVSACLLGDACRYDGKSKPCEKVEALKEKYNLIKICPEVEGGLATPRTPCEICGKRVIDKFGEDKTEQYQTGAKKALGAALENNCRLAVLKEKSPSCGKGKIYDGTFSGKLTFGDGITAAYLEKNGIKVITEADLK